MLASPSCPGLVPGRPYLQIDYARASWACDRMSSSALRCWLRLLTYFRNDRPIPAQTTRSLARIAGVSQASARKALAELLPLVAFSMPDAEDELEEQGPETTEQKPTEQKPLTPDPRKEGGEQNSLTCEQDSGGGEQKRLSNEGFETSGEQKVLSENPLCNWIALESPTGEQKTLTSHGAPGPAEQKVLTPRAEKTQKRAEKTQQRAENAHPSISSKEVEKKGITPPPTSSSAAQAGATASRSEEEEGPFLDNLTWSEPSSQANSQQPLTGGNSPLAAFPGEAPQGPVVVPDPNFDPHRIPVDRRLFEVGAELMHFWCGKPGPRNAMAFAVLQSELIQIAESPLGGIEAVREQLVTGVQKGWAMVKFRTWHSWRQSQPQPVLVSDEELDEGSLWPGLPSFIRRYRATYGKSCSDTEVTCAYISHREKLLKQANPGGQDLGPNAWMHSAHVPNPTLPSAMELASYAAEWQQSQASFRSALVHQGGGA